MGGVTLTACLQVYASVDNSMPESSLPPFVMLKDCCVCEATRTAVPSRRKMPQLLLPWTALALGGEAGPFPLERRGGVSRATAEEDEAELTRVAQPSRYAGALRCCGGREEAERSLGPHSPAPPPPRLRTGLRLTVETVISY